MACNPDFVQYISDQCSDAGEIAVKKMMGDYCIYCDGILFGLICDNNLYLKVTEPGRALLKEVILRPPYDGAKDYFYISDVDDREYLANLIKATLPELPKPKAKKSPMKYQSKKIAMTDKQIIEDIVRSIARSFSGAESTKEWTKETIWFDAAPYACVGADKAKAVFDEAFGNLRSCEVEILDIRTRISGDAALVCSVQKWDTVNKDGSVNPPFMMRQTDYLEKQDGVWKVLHEHTSPAQGWDGKIDE